MTMNLPKSTNVFDFITEATKEQSKLRIAIAGPSGSGKTFSLINIMMELGAENICVLDTEHGSAAKYANEFPRKFKVIDNKFWQSNYDPRRLIAVLKQIGDKFDAIVVDSLTHFWMGPGGMLSIVDETAKKAAARPGGKYDTFGAWKTADPIYAELVQTILALPCHFGAGMRAKAEYEDQVDERGKKKKVKVGNAAQMRDGFEYEFDVEGMMTMDHDFVVGKTRCRALDGQIYKLPGENIAKPLLAWLTDGVPQAVQPKSVFLEQPQNDTTAEQPVADTAANTQALLEKVKAAASEDELRTAVANEIREAVKDKRITTEQYNTVLTPAYSARMKELKAA